MRDAFELAIEHTRRLLGRIVEIETKSDDDGQLERDGLISAEAHDERVEEFGEMIEVAETALFRASEALLEGLPAEHASALRRFIAAHHEAMADEDCSARLAHVRERALEAVSVGLGVRGAAELRARREPLRVAREALAVIAERERPARDKQTLSHVLDLLDELPVRFGLMPLAEQALRSMSREGRVPPLRRAALCDAHRAIVDLIEGGATVAEARARVARALEAYDAAIEVGAIEA